MRRLACPRCQNVVTVQDSQKPACQACGFGTPLATPTKTRKVLVPVVAVLAVLVLGGAAAGVWFWAPWDDGSAPSTSSNATCTSIQSRLAFDGTADRAFVFTLIVDGEPTASRDVEARAIGFGGTAFGPRECVTGKQKVQLQVAEGGEERAFELDWRACRSELSAVVIAEGDAPLTSSIKCVD